MVYTQQERVHRFLARQVHKKKKGWDFCDVVDPRRQASVDHPYTAIIWSLLLGLFTNQRTLRDVEKQALGSWSRNLVPDPVSDTTLDTEARRLDAESLVDKLVLQVRDMQRSKMLKPTVLPFGVATIDGKNLTTVDHDAAGTGHVRSKENTKWHPADKRETDGTYWLMPALRSTLISTESMPCIYQMRLMPGTGESSAALCEVTNALHQAYGRGNLFEVFDVDAGLTSLDGANHINQLGYGYVMGLKGNQPELHAEAQRLLVPQTKVCSPEARTRWEPRNGKEIRRSLWRTPEMRGYSNSVGCWSHLRQTWLVRQETKHPDGRIEIEDRYFVTSLLWNRLNAAQILWLVRAHWGVECAFNGLDLQWQEDSGVWCTQGLAVWGLGVLRMMAYNVVQLIRRRRLRRKDDTGTWSHPLPWRETFKIIEWALAGFFTPVERKTTCV